MSQHFALFLLQAQGGTGSLLFSLLPMIMIFVLFYFMILAPQRKRQQQTQMMLESLKVGDQVLTSGGLCGVVAVISEDKRFLQLRISESPAVRVKVLRSSVTERLPETTEGKK